MLRSFSEVNKFKRLHRMPSMSIIGCGKSLKKKFNRKSNQHSSLAAFFSSPSTRWLVAIKRAGKRDKMRGLGTHVISFQLSRWPQQFLKNLSYHIHNISFPDDVVSLDNDKRGWRDMFRPCATQRLFFPVSIRYTLFQSYIPLFFFCVF